MISVWEMATLEADSRQHVLPSDIKEIVERERQVTEAEALHLANCETCWTALTWYVLVRNQPELEEIA